MSRIISWAAVVAGGSAFISRLQPVFRLYSAYVPVAVSLLVFELAGPGGGRVLAKLAEVSVATARISRIHRLNALIVDLTARRFMPVGRRLPRRQSRRGSR